MIGFIPKVSNAGTLTLSTLYSPISPSSTVVCSKYSVILGLFAKTLPARVRIPDVILLTSKEVDEIGHLKFL